MRLCVPDEIAREVDSPMQLTKEIVKFGIAYELESRDSGYMYAKHDNGYMAFTFECDSRAEASVVEKIMKIKFSKITVLNSWEYVDTAGLAEILGHTYVPGTYEDYVAVGRKLFMHMVETAKLVFPSKYLGKYGTEYAPTSSNVSAKFTGRGKTISSSLAIDYGYKTPAIIWTPLSVENCEPVISDSRIQARSMSRLDPLQAIACNNILGIDVLDESFKQVHDVRFEDVRMLALEGDDGRHAYTLIRELLQEPVRVPKNDVAAMKLYYATVIAWQADPSKVDDTFYTEHVVKGPCDLYRARRFALMATSDIDDVRKDLLDEIHKISDLPDLQRNIDLYRCKVEAEYSPLLHAYEWLLGCTHDSDREALCTLSDICVDADAVDQSYMSLRESMPPNDMLRFLRMFELKASSSSFIAFKRVMSVAFHVQVARHDRRGDRPGFKKIACKCSWLRGMRDMYDVAFLRHLCPANVI